MTMASSRWKRFAFFDRKNLSLPPAVVKDLIPPKSSIPRSVNSSTGGTNDSNNNNNNNNLDPAFLYRDDENESTLEDCAKIGHGEYFSLVAASNVSLPSSLLAGSGGGDGEGNDGDDYDVATKRGAGGDGASAMQAGLVALHNIDNINNGKRASSSKGGIGSNAKTIREEGAGGGEGGGDGELLLLFASSRNTPLVHCIDVTVRCTPSNPHLSRQNQDQQQRADAALATISDPTAGGGGIIPSGNSHEGQNQNAFASSLGNNVANNNNNNNNIAPPTNNNNNNNNPTSMANPEELDGWRGHYNPFQTCDGFVTGRKDVSLLGGSGGGSAANNTTSSPMPPLSKSSKQGGGGTSRRKVTAEQRILEEHMGGGGGGDGNYDTSGSGGLFGASPFSNEYNPMESSASAPLVQKARVVGLATCQYHPPSRNNKSSSSSTLHVAAITDTPNTIGVVVHVNPHLMLSMQSPSNSNINSSSKSSSNMYSSYYKPSSMGAFNFKTQGKPRCVSMLPGVVCVGTDTGTVLIYVFKCDNENANNNNGGGGGRLSLVAEVPAPRSDNEGDAAEGRKTYAVSSVELIGPAANDDDGAHGSNNTSRVHRLFVSYRRRCNPSSGNATGSNGNNADPRNDPGANAPTAASSSSSSGPSGGVCCYDLGGLRIPGRPLPPGLSANAPVVSARYDLDGRDVGTSCLCDRVSLPPAPPSARTPHSGDGNGDGPLDADAGAAASSPNDDANVGKMPPRYAVARGDGLHLYSPEEKVGVCPIDGNKIAACSLPPPPVAYLRRPVRPPSSRDGGERGDGTACGAGASYALVATTDSKSGRDVVDIYDTTNKLVGFHVLLSPGHRALRTVGVFSSPTVGGTGGGGMGGMGASTMSLLRGGRSNAVVFTSGGSIVTLTEKATPDRVDLLVQKNLYSAAISVAFSDPQFYRAEDITALYRQHAEHLYRKGDFAAAMDQYILTIGSLESSHVIFRYLDAPKISLAVKYLESLRSAGLASGVHDELLRTCYLKLGDVDAASKIVLASSSNPCADAPMNPDGSELPTVPISRDLLACADDPSEMLAAVCSLDAPEAAEALVAHGVMIARSLPRETAGVVIALCDGTYSPTALADAAAGRPAVGRNEYGEASGLKCTKYPISLFANAFMENPKLFRLILAHCRRNDCVLTPMLRRTLLELTLDEWNAAKRTGDTQVEKLRHDEAIVMLSENHVDHMGDYESLVIVQAAGFTQGEILLYERLNMVPMLLEEYARRGTERARRQMLAMCDLHDPDLFAEVLAHFVKMAGERWNKGMLKEEASVNSESEVGGLLHDIHEALVMARDHGDLPPVRVLRILAGEGHGMFHSDKHHGSNQSGGGRCGVPLSAAMDYVSAILDDSSRKMHRLKNNVYEYSRLCNDMELEINALLSPGSPGKQSEVGKKSALPNVDIDEMYSSLCQLEEDSHTISGQSTQAGRAAEFERIEATKEDFWREMEHSDDPFETICFYISKGYLENI